MEVYPVQLAQILRLGFSIVKYSGVDTPVYKYYWTWFSSVAPELYYY